jgi:hypothetical protein
MGGGLQPEEATVAAELIGKFNGEYKMRESWPWGVEVVTGLVKWCLRSGHGQEMVLAAWESSGQPSG